MTRAAEIARAVGHRPWPLPSQPWVMFQSWRHLLFAHWPVATRQLRALVPPPLTIDEFDGSAWVGMTPFVLTGLRPRLLPPLPYVSQFPEINLRTYVRVGDVPGIYFFTLEAASWLAVLAARALYGLPYRYATMNVRRTAAGVSYRSRRIGGDAELVAEYAPTGPAFVPRAGTLEHFLIERYALYVVRFGAITLRGEIHHEPWRVQPAQAQLRRNSIPAAHGLMLDDRPALLHFSGRQDTLAWLPYPVPGIAPSKRRAA